MGDSRPLLYLMSPLGLYWTDVLAEAKQWPFETLTGCPVQVEAAEGMFPDARSWAAAWPSLRERYDFGVFLDHLGGWVPRGVWAEACDLTGMGKPVWWFRSGDPVRRFGFGPGRPGDWKLCYRSVYALPDEGGSCERDQLRGERRVLAGHRKGRP